MEGILVKTDGKYKLLNNDRVTIDGLLSLENCENVENDSIRIIEDGIGYAGSKGHPDPAGFTDEQVGLLHGYIDGYEQAVKDLSDKKFNEADMIRFANEVYKLRLENKVFEGMPELIQSFQNSEWPVEIETTTVWVGQCSCPCHSAKATIMHFMACCSPTPIESPKLDSQGCLKLKRKHDERKID